MKVEERLKKLKELGFEQSSQYSVQWYNDQLDVIVYVDSEGKITSVQICKSWHLGIQSYKVYDNYIGNPEDFINSLTNKQIAKQIENIIKEK